MGFLYSLGNQLGELPSAQGVKETVLLLPLVNVKGWGENQNYKLCYNLPNHATRVRDTRSETAGFRKCTTCY